MSRKFQLARRTLLRGAGVALALPWLEAMQLPSRRLLAAVESSPPVRLAWVFIPNGTHSERWLSEADGDSWKVTPSLEPLADLRSDISVLRGLAQVNARALGDGPGDHARSAAAFLTGAHPFKTAGSKIRVGKSIDQVIADSSGSATRLQSVELGTEEGKNAGSCDSGYACAYSGSISWRSESQPMGKEINPRQAFERLFGSKSSSGQDAAKRLAIRTSILDSVQSARESLLKKLGSEDKQKIEEYFSSVREVEARLERANQNVDLGDPNASDAFEKPANFGEQIRLMYDLMVLAFRTDTTRVATFMVANEGSNRSFPMIDIKEGHHQLSHHQNKKDSYEKVAKIDRYYCEHFAYFVKRLKETADGQSSLLDNSLIVYGGAICDGNKHDHHDLPILLAGRGGGKIQSGRFHRFPNETPLNNLFLTMADCCGVELPELGDSTGLLRMGL
ncbi:MAG: DUF1552 domain-containing protein [Pirellulaceae bacterium]|nr:DUF1552 domain-containing protein [Pirellulaceae bacterium]